MKNWSNAQHEEVLAEKKYFKQQREIARLKAERDACNTQTEIQMYNDLIKLKEEIIQRKRGW